MYNGNYHEAITVYNRSNVADNSAEGKAGKISLISGRLFSAFFIGGKRKWVILWIIERKKSITASLQEIAAAFCKRP